MISLPLSWRPSAHLRLMGELILSVFSMAIIFVFVVLPTIKTISYLHTTIYQEYQDMETRYQQGHNLRTLTKQLVEAKDSLSALEEMFFNPQNPLERIQWLENLAKKNGLSSDSSITPPPTNQSALVIEMRLKGSWVSLHNFLYELDHAATYVTINHLTITAQNGETSAVLFLQLTPQPLSTTTL